MTADALQDFFFQNSHIQWIDDEDKHRVRFRNPRLPWYKNHPTGSTDITYDRLATLCPDRLLKVINQGLMVEGITRITGYMTKTSLWNPGKLAELKDRRRTDLEGHCPYEVQPMAAVG